MSATATSSGSGAAAPSTRMESADRRRSLVGLGLALAGSSAVLLYLGRHQTFIQDMWYFLLNRQGLSGRAFFEPHNEHIVVIPVGIVKLLVAAFGMSSALPERIVLTAMLCATAALVYVYVRRRIGPWPALIAAVLLLFLGPSWSVLLWPFEMVIVGSVMTGVAMLLLLEREDRVGDVWACVALTASVGFSSLGVAFIPAAAVDVYLRRRERGLTRAWIAAVPLALYGLWYVTWGHEVPHHITLDNILSSPVYMMNGLASSLDSLLGLSTINVNDVGQPEWGRPLLIAAIGLVIYGQTRKRGFSPRLWPVAAATASYWLLAGFNYMPGREPVAGRYGYAGAAFVLMVAADLLKGVRFSRTAFLVGGGVAVLAAAANLVALRNGHDWLENVSQLSRADTAGIEIASRTVSPSFTLTPEVAGTASLLAVNARQYLEAVGKHGSPAYSPAELAAAPEAYRRQADIVLSQALPLQTETTIGSYTPNPPAAGSCVTLSPGSRPAAGVRLTPGLTRIEVAPGPHASFSLRRFAVGEFPVPTEGAPGDSSTSLRIPRDHASRPWYLQVEAQQLARVCR